MSSLWAIIAMLAAGASGVIAGRRKARRDHVRGGSSGGPETGQGFSDSLEAELDETLAERFPASRRSFLRNALRVRHGADDVVVPLDHLRHVLTDRPSRAELEKAHLLAETDRALRRRALEAPNFEDLASDVVPVVLSRARAERIDEQRLYVVRLSEDMEVGFALGTPSAGQWVTFKDVVRWDLDARELMQRSLDNLWRVSEGTVVHQDDKSPSPVFYLRDGDGLDASRVLLRGLWEKLGEQMGDDILICVPSRDRIYATVGSDPQSIGHMVERMADDWLERPHAVSPRIWRWNGATLERWEMHG